MVLDEHHVTRHKTKTNNGPLSNLSTQPSPFLAEISGNNVQNAHFKRYWYLTTNQTLNLPNLNEWRTRKQITSLATKHKKWIEMNWKLHTVLTSFNYKLEQTHVHTQWVGNITSYMHIGFYALVSICDELVSIPIETRNLYFSCSKWSFSLFRTIKNHEYVWK